MILNLLKNHYFSHNFSQIILCIPRMSINQMDKTVQEYKAATNILIQVRAELALFLNDIYLQWRRKGMVRESKVLHKNPETSYVEEGFSGI